MQHTILNSPRKPVHSINYKISLTIMIHNKTLFRSLFIFRRQSTSTINNDEQDDLFILWAHLGTGISHSKREVLEKMKVNGSRQSKR